MNIPDKLTTPKEALERVLAMSLNEYSNHEIVIHTPFCDIRNDEYQPLIFATYLQLAERGHYKITFK